MVDALVKTMSELNPAFDRTRQIPSLAHAIEQVIRDGLEHLRIPTPSRVKDFRQPFLQNSQSLGDVVLRVGQLVEVIRSTPEHLDKYKQLCRDLKMLTNNMPSPGIPMCWNSTYDMLVAAHEKRRVLEKAAALVDSQQHYCLEEEEWNLVSDFTTLFEPFRDVNQILSETKRVTASRTLLLVQALLSLMKGRDQRLQEGRLFPKGTILDEAQRSSIKACSKSMIEKFENYEKRLQGVDAFILATVLDPQVKANHIPLHDHERLKSCIRQMLDEVEHKDYPAHPRQLTGQDGSNEKSATRKGSGLQLVSVMKRMIGSSSTLAISHPDEMETYLQQSTVKEDTLGWWKQEGCHAFPKLATIAKDFLAAYAINAPDERFFSPDKEVVTYSGCNLNVKSISMLMTLKCWLQQAEADSRVANKRKNADDDGDEDEIRGDSDEEDGDMKGWF